jgi:hypothetical protein
MDRNDLTANRRGVSVMRTISFGFYEVKDGKFRHIRAARYKQIHDWRMEPS